MQAALLIIDAQNEYFAPHGKWVLPDGEAALANTLKLLAAARAADAPVIHITHEHLDPAGPVFRAGSVGGAHPAIDVRPGERRLVKHVADAFTGTPLELVLRRAGVNTLIIAGYMTQRCCDTTTRQPAERGFSVLFAGDATAAQELKLHGRVFPHHAVHEATLAAMTQFATVTTTADVLAKLAPAAVPTD